jgi:glycerol dehydrogenase-like iron-containing ADH family enzyme
VEHGEQEPQVAGNRCLQREKRLDLVLDGEEVLVHLVIEGDHFVGQLAIALLERADRPADGAEHALSHLLELSLDLLEVGVDRHR